MSIIIQVLKFMVLYLDFRSKPLLNLKIVATGLSLANDIHLIDSCHDHLPVQYASDIDYFARSDTGVVIDSVAELHVHNKPLVSPIGCPCFRWLFRFSVYIPTKPLT